jgi:tetratricopeptide (TPR) repeat protein
MESPFAEAAGYYYNYTLYQAGEYEKALKGFLSLQESREFGSSVKFCIAQIYYYQGKYEEVIGLASALIRNSMPEQQTEMARLLGDSYCRLDRFAEAIPFLEQYRKGIKTLTREEHYILGYAYYQNRQIQEAIKELELVSDANDALTQYSAHLLGGMFIEQGEKLKARTAFRKASVLTFDKALQEESLLNYAKLNFDLSISGETLRAFEEFLKTFPESLYRDEVYDYLVKVFMNTRNYQEALVTLDKIENKTPEVRKAFQRIAYYRGLELFNNLKFREAIDMFDRSLEYGNYDDRIRALCYYWQA